MSDSIFTKIIKGEIPSYKIYEDANAYAFMDIHPIQPGQVLVVPKKQVGFVWDMDSEDYHQLMGAVLKVGRRMREVFPDKKRIGVMIEGLDVEDHVHVKIFPFNSGNEYRQLPDHSKEPEHEVLAEMAKKLAS